MLTTVAPAHPPYLQREPEHLVQQYAGPNRWRRWLEDRQRFQVFGWYPTTCREDRLWGLVPRLTATFVRMPEDEAEAWLSQAYEASRMR
jgi:hypothetical protein